MDNFQVELLTEELKRLVGWGAHPKRLPLLENLASLAQVPSDMGYVAAGYLIQRFLLAGIDSLEGTYEFEGREIPAEKLRRAYRLLFQYEGKNLNAPNRRYRTIMLLGVRGTPDQWRKPISPEFDLMLLLAKHMTERSTSQPV